MARSDSLEWWARRYGRNLAWALGMNLLFLVLEADSYAGPAHFVAFTLLLSIGFLALDVAYGAIFED